MQTWGVIEKYGRGFAPYSPFVADNRMYNANAITFNGTDAFLATGGPFIGAADSKLWTVSFWIKVATGGDGTTFRLFNGNTTVGGGVATARTRFAKTNSTSFQLLGYNAAGTEILNILSSNNSIEVADGWVHVLASVDMANAASRHIYINDTSDLASVTTYTNDTIEFTYADWGICAQPDGSGLFAGDLADVWVFPGVYIDFSVTANRRLFIDAQLRPVSLGPTGAIPTGTSPLFYMRGPAALVATNFGTGGNTTSTGTFTNSSPGPSR